MIYSKGSESLAKEVLSDIAGLSPETSLIEELVEFNDPWDFEEVYGKLLDLVESRPFEPEREDYLFHITTGTHVAQICAFLLAESRRFPGKLLQTGPSRTRGAMGDIDIVDLDLSRYDKIASRFLREANDDIAFLKSGIDTQNKAFNSLIELIGKVALKSEDPMLLTGPTGSGKSRLARQLYELKRQRRGLKGPFVEVNCATLRGDGAMSALFGHTKGAYTGAVGDRKGLLLAADGGMVFLDEVAELGIDEQAMLLRAVEEKRFLSVGADMESASDFQLICGTNKDLRAEVGRGLFREDLLARIDLWTFRLPGLRERPEDIPPNVEYELRLLEKERGTRVSFNREALARFLSFASSPEAVWLANFRDLKAAVTRMAALSEGARIGLRDVEEEVLRLKASWDRGDRAAGALAYSHPEDMDLFDRCQLETVLEVCASSASMAEAGRRLFAVTRLGKGSVNDSDRLKKYLARFGFDWDMARGGAMPPGNPSPNRS